jgi:ribosomal protein L40E
MASGRLGQVPGVSLSGTTVNPIRFEYELCYRCHADNPGPNPPVVTRVLFEKNLRLKFQSSNASYHPVEAIGRNTDVPSLLIPYTTSSLIYCTDCHNSDSGPNAGGAGPSGPHGSIWGPLLERQLTTADLTSENSQVYALCYKCHNRSSILLNQSFRYHALHIVYQRTPCTACHDSHGVGTNAHLMNFDKTIVFPNSKGILRYEAQGRFTGACYLQCHGKDHNPKVYP